MTTITTTTNNNFIDIHSHIIFNVDDGSKSLKISKQYLDQAKKVGLKTIICTPHIKHARIDRIKRIKANYLELREYAKEIGIELLLGNEIMLTEETITLLKTKKLYPLNGGKYVLVEVRRNEKMDIDTLIYNLEEIMDLGFTPILAHPELYINYRDIDNFRKVKDAGILLQMDTTSICRKYTNRKIYKFSHKLLKERLIDFVSSDTHCNKKRNYISFKDAYKKVCKKYGREYANILFYENAKEILSK